MPKVPPYKLSLLVIWAAFLIRGCFYAALLPLWEGYDEYSHFAYVEQLFISKRPLVDRNQPVPPDVAASLQLTPLPWELRSFPPPAVTVDAFWKLSTNEKSLRIERLRKLRAGMNVDRGDSNITIYEALQAPLYYWMAAIAYAIAGNRTLLESVFALRIFSILIASFLIPLVFLAARQSMPPHIATAVAAIVALLPELLFDIARVGNECLGVMLFTLLLLLCSLSREGKQPIRRAGMIGISLGMGLLTKAYFITAVPAVLVLAQPLKSRLHARRAAVIVGTAALVSGWWYLNNKLTTGSWSGLNEALMIQGATIADLVRGAARVDWHNAVDSILLSHIWFGGWSSLQVRGWIYHFFMAVAAAGAMGIALIAFRAGSARRVEVAAPLTFYLWFWLGQLYNVLLLFLSKGASTSMGWYLYAVVAAELILLVHGLCYIAPKQFARWLPPLLASAFAALDLYTVHFVAAPYYIGLTSHRPNGTITNFHTSQLSQIGWHQILERLCATKPLWFMPGIFATLWALYLVATLVLVAASWSLTETARERQQQ